MGKLPTVVSYFTKDTLYEKEADYLIASCEKFNLTYEVDGVPNLGSWENNCCFKPSFLLEKLKKLQRPILWADADAAFVKHPALLESLDCDLAVWIDPNLDPTHPSKVISAAIYLNYTPKTLSLVSSWNERCKHALASANNEVWDQTCLRDEILNPHQTAKITPLPQEYCMIYDKVQEDSDPVIMQYQASRLYKKFINNEVSPFFETFPHDEMRALRESHLPK